MRKVLDIAIGVGLWFALGGFLGGCGDAPAGADRCGGKCKGPEQCALTKIELTGPACYPSSSCTSYGFTCVDPAAVKIMSLEPEQ
jgi:hypothetical protein